MSAVNTPATADLTTPAPKSLDPVGEGNEMSQKTDEDKYAHWPGWATVESEPAVFQALLREIGVSGAQVEEIYTLADEEALRALNPAYGIIFLFRWKPESDEEAETACPEGVWFANQVIDNACGTIALLNVVFNSDAILSEDLRNLKDFTSPLPPAMKGLAVANNAQIRDFHNSFARRQEMMAVDIDFAEAAKEKPRLNVQNIGEQNEDADETYHFIAYVHVEDTMYELDGLKKQPVKIRTCPKEDWTVHAGARILERVSGYAEGEIEFSCMAVIARSSYEDESFDKIARARKVDWEAFVHKACTILTENGMAQQILAPKTVGRKR